MGFILSFWINSMLMKSVPSCKPKEMFWEIQYQALRCSIISSLFTLGLSLTRWHLKTLVLWMQKLFHCKIEQSGPNPSADSASTFCCLHIWWWVVDRNGGGHWRWYGVNINFMHQKGLVPNSGFQWPRRPDICPVNSKDVLLNTDTPALSSNTARSYSISRDIFTTIEGIFNNRNYVSI